MLMADYTEQDIFNEVKEALVELFELDENAITPNAHLFQDLGLDSIDAVDLIVRLKNHTGIKVKSDDFKSVRTVDDAVKTVHRLTLGDNV